MLSGGTNLPPNIVHTSSPNCQKHFNGNGDNSFDSAKYVLKNET
jgi:hypothetical protein